MAKSIKVGDKVIFSTGSGRYGTRQRTGVVAVILTIPDRDGNRYMVDVPSKLRNIPPTRVLCAKVRRVK